MQTVNDDASPLRAVWAEIERLWAEREEQYARLPRGAIDDIAGRKIDHLTERLGDLYDQFLDTPAGSPTEAAFKLEIMLHHELGIDGVGWTPGRDYDALVQIAGVLAPAAQIAEAAVKGQAVAEPRNLLAETKRLGGVD